jgi:hypothetical protein
MRKIDLARFLADQANGPSVRRGQGLQSNTQSRSIPSTRSQGAVRRSGNAPRRRSY